MIYDLMNTEFPTKDLHLAAYLVLKQAELLRIDKSQVGFKAPSFFIFSDEQKCKALEKKFWDEGDFVNIKEYITTVRELRAKVSAIPYEGNNNSNS